MIEVYNANAAPAFGAQCAQPTFQQFNTARSMVGPSGQDGLPLAPAASMGAELTDLFDPSTPSRQARQGDRHHLATALLQARHETLALFDAIEAALPGLQVPYHPDLNPMLWEFGHLAWFEEFWLARNPQRLRGVAADPQVARGPSLMKDADALYDSTTVAHAKRWQLDLPGAARTRRYAAQVRAGSLALLAGMPWDDDALYFFRLILLHEDMHREAWVYMAQHLGLEIDGTSPHANVDTDPATPASEQLHFAAAHITLGTDEHGFAFDNECPAQQQALAKFSIDARPVSWGRFMEFVEAGGYDNPVHWTAEGWAWRQAQRSGLPRYVAPQDSAAAGDGDPEPQGGIAGFARAQSQGPWRRNVFGRWQALEQDQAASNISHHEASAWCRWAGRRLPTEAEWQHAAQTGGAAFQWGQVWDWTASAFAGFPGFEAHPYRDYSAPWFDGRPVLRGASFATSARVKDPRYRNYFPPERNDLFAGFRTCALG